MPKYAEIALPDFVIPNRETLTYQVPEGTRTHPGDLVLVPLRKRLVMGVIMELHEKKPPYATRPIEKTLIPQLLLPWQRQVIAAIAQRYSAPLGTAVSLFLPPNMVSKKENPAPAKTASTGKKKGAIEAIIFQSSAEKPIRYGQAVERALQKKKQAILVLPDIAAVSLFTPLFQKQFGGALTLYHSGLTTKQKREAFWRIAMGKAAVVIGTRGALYAPVRNLGLLILDDEEEEVYKEDRKPHCHARVVAEMIAQHAGARVVLGSEAMSLETWQTKKPQPPEKEQRAITVVNLTDERKQGNKTPISDPLKIALAQTKEQGGQAILYLNKRGDAAAAICMDCQYRAICPLCDTTLTFYGQTLQCSRCPFVRPSLTFCPTCKGTRIRFVGYGTQAVERLLEEHLPNLRLVGFDRDLIKTPEQAEAIISAFQQKKIDVLVGTSLLVSYRARLKADLLAFLHAELGANIPDFRAAERTFQKLQKLIKNCVTQNGSIIVQTYEPDQPLIQAIAAQNETLFYTEEAVMRKRLQYPPYAELAKIRISDQNKAVAEKKAQSIRTLLIQQKKPWSVTATPAIPPRKRGLFQWNVLIKGDNLQKLLHDAPFPEKSAIDIDPTNIL